MKRLLILSGKGGTGKTTTAAAFVKFSEAKAIADCDVDAPNLHLVTEFSGESERKEFYGSKKAEINQETCISCGTCIPHCRFDAIRQDGGRTVIRELLCEGCGVCAYVCPQDAVLLYDDIAGERTVYKGERVFSTAKLKMGRGNSGKLVTEVKLAMLKNAPETELAIIDGSPGIGCPVIASVSGMDLVLIVTEPSVSGRSDLERLLKTTDSLQVKTAVCVNRWDISSEQTTLIEEFCGEKEIPLAGKIPYDKTVSGAVNAGKSIADIDCPARDALYECYQKVRSLLEI